MEAGDDVCVANADGRREDGLCGDFVRQRPGKLGAVFGPESDGRHAVVYGGRQELYGLRSVPGNSAFPARGPGGAVREGQHDPPVGP